MTVKKSSTNSSPTCFFNPQSSCKGCMAYKDQECQLLNLAGMFFRNQEAQTAVLQGVQKIQKETLPFLKKVIPVVTRLIDISEKAVPIMEAQMDEVLEDLMKGH